MFFCSKPVENIGSFEVNLLFFATTKNEELFNDFRIFDDPLIQKHFKQVNILFFLDIFFYFFNSKSIYFKFEKLIIAFDLFSLIIWWKVLIFFIN